MQGIRREEESSSPSGQKARVENGRDTNIVLLHNTMHAQEDSKVSLNLTEWCDIFVPQCLPFIPVHVPTQPQQYSPISWISYHPSISAENRQAILQRLPPSAEYSDIQNIQDHSHLFQPSTSQPAIFQQVVVENTTHRKLLVQNPYPESGISYDEYMSFLQLVGYLVKLMCGILELPEQCYFHSVKLVHQVYARHTMNTCHPLAIAAATLLITSKAADCALSHGDMCSLVLYLHEVALPNASIHHLRMRLPISLQARQQNQADNWHVRFLRQSEGIIVNDKLQPMNNLHELTISLLSHWIDPVHRVNMIRVLVLVVQHLDKRDGELLPMNTLMHLLKNQNLFVAEFFQSEEGQADTQKKSIQDILQEGKELNKTSHVQEKQDSNNDSLEAIDTEAITRYVVLSEDQKQQSSSTTEEHTTSSKDWLLSPAFLLTILSLLHVPATAADIAQAEALVLDCASHTVTPSNVPYQALQALKMTMPLCLQGQVGKVGIPEFLFRDQIPDRKFEQLGVNMVTPGQQLLLPTLVWALANDVVLNPICMMVSDQVLAIAITHAVLQLTRMYIPYSDDKQALQSELKNNNTLILLPSQVYPCISNGSEASTEMIYSTCILTNDTVLLQSKNNHYDDIMKHVANAWYNPLDASILPQHVQELSKFLVHHSSFTACPLNTCSIADYYDFMQYYNGMYTYKPDSQNKPISKTLGFDYKLDNLSDNITEVTNTVIQAYNSTHDDATVVILPPIQQVEYNYEYNTLLMNSTSVKNATNITNMKSHPMTTTNTNQYKQRDMSTNATSTTNNLNNHTNQMNTNTTSTSATSNTMTHNQTSYNLKEQETQSSKYNHPQQSTQNDYLSTQPSHRSQPAPQTQPTQTQPTPTQIQARPPTQIQTQQSMQTQIQTQPPTQNSALVVKNIGSLKNAMKGILKK